MAHRNWIDPLDENFAVRILHAVHVPEHGWIWHINGQTAVTQAGPHPLELTLAAADVAELAAAGQYALAEYAHLTETAAREVLNTAGFRPMQEPYLTPRLELTPMPELRVYLALTPELSARYAFLEDIEAQLPSPQEGGLICQRTHWREAASNAGHYPYARHLDWDAGEPGDGDPDDLALNVLTQLLPPVPGEETVQTATGATVTARAWRLRTAFAQDLLAPMANAGGEVPVSRLHAWLAAHP